MNSSSIGGSRAQPATSSSPIRLLLVGGVLLSAQALAAANPGAFCGALTLGVRSPARTLVAAAAAFSPVSEMSPRAILAEYRQLVRTRPGLAFPIGVTGLGIGLHVVAWGFLISSSASAVFIGLAVAFGLGGIALVALGLVELFSVIRERRSSGQRIDELQAELERLDGVAMPERALRPRFVVAVF